MGCSQPQFTDEVTKGGWKSAGIWTHVFSLLPGQLLCCMWNREPAGHLKGWGTVLAQRAWLEA